ncbi:speedy protein A isoform X1 [Larimichthys crocea]|uniref:speedy protein A isoform X1 n=1 Tax=Larimichthys crocea TaxID=215358 RepID=UPI000F5E3C00|nr:speedy protein A isoform X1 [Larimichthys crocea]XP_019123096.2 speedy protein A isoform X1 [Larimichthys crocea]XP_027131071.1 speedy protein A isoform X1 [Larimichthys crocea]
MMKHTHRWCQTPPSVTVRIKPNSSHSLQVRRGLRLKRANGQDAEGPPEKSQPGQRQDGMYNTKRTPTIIIQRQEMVAFFRLFEDDLMKDFLWMDCCCKITDKYLLAMTFVYFKRACFTIAEYTRRNLFIAMYLANTMEEDEEESKYEIFPWALGKNWKKLFPRFLKQRDKLWARIEFRAAVSRRCCEEVMAILPSHFLWQRERLEHHSGAQRQYGDQDRAGFPRGPLASPVSCALCNRGSRFDEPQGSSSPSRGSSVKTPSHAFSHPLTSMLNLETTPQRATFHRNAVKKTKIQTRHSSCYCAEEVPRDEFSCVSTYDTSMDWINEE